MAKDEPGYEQVVSNHPKLDRGATVSQLGTRGGGNHFVEVCIDEAQRVWVMLQSGSRGVGNRTGTLFIQLAEKDMARQLSNLPDKNLAYFTGGARHYEEYRLAVGRAQRYARAGDLGIIPGSMGAKSHVVRGKCDPDSFHSCSQGARRARVDVAHTLKQVVCMKG